MLSGVNLCNASDECAYRCLTVIVCCIKGLIKGICPNCLSAKFLCCTGKFAVVQGVKLEFGIVKLLFVVVVALFLELFCKLWLI
jgi:hypothetical protein